MAPLTVNSAEGKLVFIPTCPNGLPPPCAFPTCNTSTPSPS